MSTGIQIDLMDNRVEYEYKYWSATMVQVLEYLEQVSLLLHTFLQHRVC